MCLAFNWSVYILEGLPGSWEVKNSPANTGDVGFIAGLEDPVEKGNDNPLQYSCPGNPMDRGTLKGYSPWGRKELDRT